MEKNVKITPPEGYEIDKEKSTFEIIVFKKLEDVVRWDEEFHGVEINADGEHFVIEANYPSFYCSWNDAMRYFSSRIMWKLPTIKQLQIIAKHKDKIKNHTSYKAKRPPTERKWSGYILRINHSNLLVAQEFIYSFIEIFCFFIRRVP